MEKYSYITYIIPLLEKLYGNRATFIVKGNFYSVVKYLFLYYTMNSGFHQLLLKSNYIPHYQGGSPIPHHLGIKTPIIKNNAKILRKPISILPNKPVPELVKKMNQNKMEKHRLLNYVNGRL